MIYRALRALRKPQLKLIHAGIHGAVILCIIIAQVAVFSFHDKLNIPNLYTLHSWIGLSAIIIYVLQVLTYHSHSGLRCPFLEEFLIKLGHFQVSHYFDEGKSTTDSVSKNV